MFADAENYKMLKAAEFVINQKSAVPVLLGNEKVIRSLIDEHELDIPNPEIIDPRSEAEDVRRKTFAELLFQKRNRKGITLNSAIDRMHRRNYFSPMLIETGFADAMVSGLTNNYPETIRPAIEVIGKAQRFAGFRDVYR